MSPMDRSPQLRLHPAWPLALAAALLVLGLLAASPASAAYEQVGNFAGTPGELHPSSFKEWPEKVQLGGVGGMAVNVTGAGGVAPGTLYSVGQTVAEPTTVARFNPDGEFREAWTFNSNPPQRCGPAGDPAHPVCQSRPSGGGGLLDVDVDQVTGDVYVLNGESPQVGHNLIHVYSADGSKLIGEFGEEAAAGETTAASPAKLHGSSTGGMALDAAGDVYIFDLNGTDNSYHRLMEFTPQSPGDHEHYVYAGQGHDIWAGLVGETRYPETPVFDAAGDLYLSGHGQQDFIAKIDPSLPGGPVLCELKYAKGGIRSMTINPVSDEAFFFTENDKKIHQVGGACNEGKLSETTTVGPAPKRAEVTALAFNPAGQFSAGRPEGVLYAGAPSGEGGNTGKEGNTVLFESSIGYIFAHPVEVPPQVLAESFGHVSASGAQLGAQINPKGSLARYAFQYETQAQYEANEPSDRFAGAKESPQGGAVLGEGTAPLSASASLTGLAPDTTYRFRATATSHCSSEDKEKLCEGTGEALSFHTFAIEAPGLPDRRVWELVSPAQKNGGQVLPADPSIDSCFGSGACKPGAQYAKYPKLSSPDGEAVVYEGTAFSGEEGSPIENEYVARRDDKAGWQGANLTPTGLQRLSGYKAFDSGLGLGVLSQQSLALSPEAPAGYPNLYTQSTANPLAISPLLAAEPPNRTAGELKLEYAGASADLSRVFFEANDALTGETPFAPEAEDGGPAKNNLYEWERATGQLRLVNVSPGNTEAKAGASFGVASANTISADGSVAFWSSESGQVYLREDGQTTRAISSEGIPDPGKFLAAAVDGSKVLLANGHLHDLGDEEPTVDLTEGKGGFQGIAGQSEDLTHVYFVDTAVLTGEEENNQGAKAQAAKDNLYAWSEGAGTRYVATLVAEDNAGNNLHPTNDWSSSPSLRTAEASPHGRFLAFLSQARLSGYDNTGPCEVLGETQEPLQAPCPEVFLYDSATQKLSCPSCNPSGERPLGFSTLRLIAGGTATYLAQPRYLTDQGRLFFDSQDSLTPFDTNEGVEDVYQYEPEGVGQPPCQRQGGCVSLISAGREAIDSNFFAMDEGGNNVFFTSRDQLVLKDHDDLIDLYDARVEGGIPAETETARGECQGEACVPAIAAPNHPTPASAALPGDGNVEEKKATRKAHHKKRRRRHAKRHGARANHNRGGVK